MKSSPNRYSLISEDAFTRQVIELAHAYKWLVAHFRPGMNRRGEWSTAVQGDGAGFPDLVLLRHNRLIIAELKSAKGKVSPAQQTWLNGLSCANIECFIWRPADIDAIERELIR